MKYTALISFLRHLENYDDSLSKCKKYYIRNNLILKLYLPYVQKSKIQCLFLRKASGYSYSLFDSVSLLYTFDVVNRLRR